MKYPYFQFYPQDWLSDPKVTQLSFEEQGIYFRLLCLMWSLGEDCSIPDDDKFICRILSMTPGKWKKAKSVLIEGHLPVFFIENNRIFNKRLEKERKKLEEFSKIQSEKAQKRWENFDRKSLKDAESDDAGAFPGHMPETCLSESELELNIKKPSKKNGVEALSILPQKTEPKKPQPSELMDLDDLPNFVSRQIWEEFRQHRINIKHKLTAMAEKKLINHLLKLHEQGYDLESVINRSIVNDWRAFFPNQDDLKTPPQPKGSGYEANPRASQPRISSAERMRQSGIEYLRSIGEGEPDREPDRTPDGDVLDTNGGDLSASVVVEIGRTGQQCVPNLVQVASGLDSGENRYRVEKMLAN